MKCLKKVTQIIDIYLLTKHYFPKNLLKKTCPINITSLMHRTMLNLKKNYQSVQYKTKLFFSLGK